MPEIVNTSALQNIEEAFAACDDASPSMIKADHVSMSFNVANQQLNSLKEYAISLFRHELVFKEFKALDDISIDVKKGDVYGILGTNGSGKSTLLKIIAGVLDPTEGSVEINGNIAPLIELGAGFDHELTARENIYLNGSLLGYPKAFIDEHFDEIVDFAEVSSFLDMPLKNYSSGMVARIAFAIATVMVPDILIVDEVLSVGDFMFQQKCEERIQDLINEHGTTVLIVSHSNEQIERLCNKAIWIEKGHTRLIGTAQEVCRIYKALGGHVGSPESEQVIFKTLKSPTIARDIVETISSENRFGLNSKIASIAPRTKAPDTAVITVSDDYHVRLVASSIAASLNGVNIITKENELPDAAFSLLGRIKPSRVIFLERTRAIEESVVKEIETLVGDAAECVVIRDDDIVGLSKRAFEYATRAGATWQRHAFIANDDSIYASSAIASYIYRHSCPVLFGRGAYPLEDETASTLERFGIRDIVLLDCPEHIASDWRLWARNKGMETEELLGSTAAQAALNAARWAAGQADKPPARLVVSPQENLSYAYSAIPYAAGVDAVSLVVNHNDLDSMAGLIRYISEYGAQVEKITVIGGEYLFSNVDKDIIAKAVAQAQQQA